MKKNPARSRPSPSPASPARRLREGGDASDPRQPIPPDPGKTTDVEIDEDAGPAPPRREEKTRTEKKGPP